MERPLPTAPTRISVQVNMTIRMALLVDSLSSRRGCSLKVILLEPTAFALGCWPQASRLPVYRTLRLYQRIGPRVMPSLRPFAVSEFAEKAGRWLRRRSWEWRGYKGRYAR